MWQGGKSRGGAYKELTCGMSVGAEEGELEGTEGHEELFVASHGAQTAAPPAEPGLEEAFGDPEDEDFDDDLIGEEEGGDQAVDLDDDWGLDGEEENV